MNLFKKLKTILPLFVFFFLSVYVAFAAVPDGLGPWADIVFSSNQGLMKNGSAVPTVRSDPTSALGIAENDTTDSHFFSLGFGGNIILGFDNGISSGILIVESTNPNYPFEKAKVEISEDGGTWTNAGTVTQDGAVNIPQEITCAKFVRITDVSDPASFPDDIADGYDVDGVQAIGDSCTPQTSPTPTPTPGTTSSTTTTTSNVPGFPNTGTACSLPQITTIPNITQANRVSPTSIFLSWGPNGGLSNFIVRYGFQNGDWQFNTKVSGFSTIINDLPSNQSIWIQVAATNNCATGTFGTAVLVGGTPTTNSPGFPNTGFIPGLPNTGIDPNGNNFLKSISAGVHFILSTFFNALSIHNL